MKTKVISFLIASFLISNAVASFGGDNGSGGFIPPTSSRSDISQLVDGGDGDHYVPFPFGSELPFPWTIVSGVWMAKYGNFESYYSFKVQKGTGGLKQAVVNQIDVNTCETIATGVGFLQNRVLRAQMTSTNGNVYRISLRSFSEESMPVTENPIESQVVVLSIYPMETRSGYHMPIAKKVLGANVKCTPTPTR